MKTGSSPITLIYKNSTAGQLLKEKKKEEEENEDLKRSSSVK